MIKLYTRYKPKILFKKKFFQCVIGLNGVVGEYKKKEGDLSTPRGKWKIGDIYYRSDKINRFNLKYKNLKKLNKNSIWCDDPKSFYYNKYKKSKNYLIENNFNFENLHRNDDIYDLILVIKYNIKPIIKGKGSAIFIHCSSKYKNFTKGCIAIEKNNLIFLLNNLKRVNHIYIK